MNPSLQELFKAWRAKRGRTLEGIITSAVRDVQWRSLRYTDQLGRQRHSTPANDDKALSSYRKRDNNKSRK